ncbi:alpha/beta hydrolase family protein [Isoalcanivorax beigongshangi]|uniref:Alpha/beta fold hydrolase n=1 Tax=Isoalcanivorax beigongshangi TaxID=3238810 RepID=A0ABV4AIN5_9GAMM
MPTAERTWVTDDGYPLVTQHYLPPNAQPWGALAVGGALGVPTRLYRHLAEYLAQAGLLVVTFHYRGTESDTAARERIRMADWGRRDIDAVLRHLRNENPALPQFYLGHSIGGQLLGLAPAAAALRATVMVGASFPNWRFWPLPTRVQMAALFNAVLPAAARLPSFPGARLGLGPAPLPGRAIQDWCRWCTSDGYLLNPRFELHAEQRYAALDWPLISYHFSDDKLVPMPALEALYRAYAGAALHRRHLTPTHGSIGHMGFFHPTQGAEYWPGLVKDLRRWAQD